MGALLASLLAAPALACSDGSPPPSPAALERLPAAQCGVLLARIRDTFRLHPSGCRPTSGELESDPAFCRLVALGDKATSCLLDKVTDTTRMPNPSCPETSQGRHAVGDLAYTVLTQLHDLPWEAPLPPDVRKRMRVTGSYVYYDWVNSDPTARRQLRTWVAGQLRPVSVAPSPGGKLRTQTAERRP